MTQITLNLIKKKEEKIMYRTEVQYKLFKNIFPDYETFASWYKSTPLSDDENDVPTKKTFSLIAYEYNDNHVAFTDESFKERFAIDIYTYYREFEETTKSILAMMQLTDEEIATADSYITNTAVIPETVMSTNVEEVDFVTSQQKQINKKGKLQVKREQLSTKRTFTTRTFIKRFKHLFVKIIDDAYTPVIEENMED